MTLKKPIALILICTTAFSSLASAATPFAQEDLEDAQVAETAKQHPLLGKLLKKIVDSGAFDGEEGKQKFYQGLELGLEANRQAALKNLDRLSDEELANQVARISKR